MERKRILLADDHEGFLRRVRALLDGHYEIVASALDGEELVEAVRTLQPDLVISDITMPAMSGFEAILKIRSLGLKTKFILLTVHSSPAYLRRALSLGVEGYVVKLHTVEQLLTATAAVLGGETFISPQLGILRE